MHGFDHQLGPDFRDFFTLSEGLSSHRSLQCIYVIFTSWIARSARIAGPNIAFRFSRLFVCASALITCTIFYVIRYYAVF